MCASRPLAFGEEVKGERENACSIDDRGKQEEDVRRCGSTRQLIELLVVCCICVCVGSIINEYCTLMSPVLCLQASNQHSTETKGREEKLI